MPSIVSPFTVVARPADPPAGQPPFVGRTVFDKQFAGPLVATGVVEMVYAAGDDGPLQYVAIERIEGVLEGRSGAFALQHVGSMAGGVPTIVLTVVAGSGTGDLDGLSGGGTIVHTDDGARLELDYSLG
ncbi:MAG TPA: DUF3224 domain-containing protein [Candidatus Nanopelagicales bacterium]|nr:DUF3224 domain-containing protein [Candidatus Nanopelagicales bacterium]